jgi:putative hemolysin
MRRPLLLGLAAVVLCAAATVAVADSLRWSLGLSHDVPSWVRINVGAGKTVAASYLKYTVHNASGDARKPNVRIEFHTDSGKVYRDGGDPRVVSAASKTLKISDLKTAWDLRTGIANDAKVNCIASFGEIDVMAKTGELRVYGLQDPIDVVDGKKFQDIRYWSVKYTRTGDEFRRTEDSWKQGEAKWVVESRTELAAKEK